MRKHLFQVELYPLFKKIIQFLTPVTSECDFFGHRVIVDVISSIMMRSYQSRVGPIPR
jgi:hypothetical protein